MGLNYNFHMKKIQFSNKRPKKPEQPLSTVFYWIKESEKDRKDKMSQELYKLHGLEASLSYEDYGNRENSFPFQVTSQMVTSEKWDETLDNLEKTDNFLGYYIQC